MQNWWRSHFVFCKIKIKTLVCRSILVSVVAIAKEFNYCTATLLHFSIKKLSRTTSALTKEVSKQKEFLIASDGHFRHLIALLLWIRFNSTPFLLLSTYNNKRRGFLSLLQVVFIVLLHTTSPIYVLAQFTGTKVFYLGLNRGQKISTTFLERIGTV